MSPNLFIEFIESRNPGITHLHTRATHRLVDLLYGKLWSSGFVVVRPALLELFLYLSLGPRTFAVIKVK